MTNCNQDSFCFAEGVTRSFNVKETGLNNNVIVIGGTGTGKTKSYTEPLLLHSFNHNLIVSLAKQSVVRQYAPILKNRGYRVYILNIANPQAGNIGYDPLRFLHSDKDILSLADSIITMGDKQGKDRDPYWNNTATQLVAAEISMIMELTPIYKEVNNEKGRTFSAVLDVNEHLQFSDKNSSGFTCSSLDNEFDALEDYNQSSYAVKCFKAVKGLAAKTVSCISSTVNTAYGTVFPPSVTKLFDMDENLDIQQFVNEKCVLFIIYSAIDQTSQLFSNIVNFQLMKELFEYAENECGGALPIPIHMVNDDFAITKIPRYSEYISIFREAGISTSMLVQSQSQLSSMYGYDHAKTIVNNCDTMVYLGGMDLDTCEDMSRRLNVPLDEVLYMPLETAVVITRGTKPVIAKRYQIYEDELYKNLAQ